MLGPSWFFLIAVLAGVLGVSLLTFVLVRRVFELYRKPQVAYIYWAVNFAALVGAFYGRGRLDHFFWSAAAVRFLIIWLTAQFAMLLLTPLFYFIKKRIERSYSEEAIPVDQTRRKLLKSAAIALPAAGFSVGAYGAVYESVQIRALHHDVRLPDLAADFEGYRIAQLSDVHLGMFFSPEKLRETLERVAGEGAQALVITGDLIDDVTMLDETVKILDAYVERFKDGVYFCWGNHEYFREFSRIAKAFGASKITVLRNSSVKLADAACPLYMLGVDYPWAKNKAEQAKRSAAMLDTALRGVPERATRILLSHHPDFIDHGFEKNVDLTITGHTHGGQVAILGHSLLSFGYKYMRGMYRQEQRYGYVSVGTGSWFPFRFGCQAEYAVFELHRT